MKRENRLFKMVAKVNFICGLVSAAGIICLSGVTVFEGVSRKIFNAPTVWSFDVSKYLFLFISFLAFAFTMQQNGHISFDFLVEQAEKSRRWSRILAIISGIFGTLFCFYLGYASFTLNVMAIKGNWMTRGVAQIPAFYLYTAMCLGAFLLLITFVMKTVSSIIGSGKETTPT